ncbi:MAG TPA: hypothetical protein PL009_08635 [Flavipsychrobacter sp.]|nr:hypothetical protein [Flavipsychrobacter sp.]
MSEQQTYKAKGTSLVVLLLLIIAGIGNKACKTAYLPPKLKKSSVAVFPSKEKEVLKTQPTKQSPKSISKSNPDKKREEDTTRLPKINQTTLATVPIFQTPRGFQKDTGVPGVRLQKISEPRLSFIPTEEEIKALELELRSENHLLFPFAGKKLSDTATQKKSVAENGKLLENTGSSYFNAEVKANMNDQIKAIFTTKLMHDSVVAHSNKEFVYNTVTVYNNTASKIELQIIITGPKGWQMITSNIANIILEPFASSVIPMRFSPSGNNTATWQEVRIEYRINNVIDTRKNFFRIKVQEYSSFKASLPNSNQVLTGYQKNNTIPVFVKNSGNTTGKYLIAAVNQLLKLNYSTEIQLPPGKDTTFFLPLTLSESQFAMLKKEDIRISVANEKKEVINLIQSFSKVGYILKDHASAWLEMPLQLEVGTMYQGSQSPIQYYGALFGSLDLSERDRVSMSLRSNTIAQGQTNNNSIVRLDYTGKNFSASLGNVQGAGEFMVDGYGARVGYEWEGNNKAEVFATVKSRSGDTKVGGVALQLGLKENLRIYDALSLSQDNVRLMNSGILSQITEYKFEKGRFALITGLGVEKNNAQLAEGGKSSLMGSSFGYNLQYTSKRIGVMSNVLYNSDNYPGTFKGQRVQQHDLKWLLGKHFLGSYFEYNFRKQSYWQDSLFLENVFNGKTTNYGIKGGVNLKGTSFVLAVGNQQQIQQGEGTYQTNYNYLNLNIATVLFKSLFINLNSFGGNMSTIGGTKHSAFISTTQGNVQYKKFGASFRYDNGPYYYQEFVSYIQKPEDYQRIIFSPFAEFHLLNKALHVRTQANYAQTQPANVSNTSVLTNINYAAKNYDFNINGILPIGANANNQTYINAAFRMRIKAPFIAVRKYYNLTMVLFKDLNSNGVKDNGEEPVSGQTLSLNGDLFVSDATGLVIYKNTEKGAYKADFGYSSKLKGWMPSDGTIQYYELTGNKTILIPYKVSRVLSGKLLVEKDSLSNAGFNPHNIKVSATGQNGEVYATLTDENGEFYFNVPSGNYVVSLSDAAFGDQFKPVQFSQPADLVNNNIKTLYFEIKQKKRQINIRKK